MADDKIISQDDIEKLLSQATGPAVPAAKSAKPPIASADTRRLPIIAQQADAG